MRCEAAHVADSENGSSAFDCVGHCIVVDFLRQVITNVLRSVFDAGLFLCLLLGV
jgi:hypothetical protein